MKSLCIFQAIDVGLAIDQSLKKQTEDPHKGQSFLKSEGYENFASTVPLLSLYNHLVIYLFLPIAKKTVALAFGCASSLVCLGLFLGIELSQQVFSSAFIYLALAITSRRRMAVVWKAAKLPLNLWRISYFMLR